MTDDTATGPLTYETTKGIEQQLRMLGYERGTVEWDGALAAARAYAAARPAVTGPEWVTVRFEDAQRLFDLAIDTPLLCSGSFETDDVRVLRAFAKTIGVDPAKATPDEFVSDFPHPFKPFTARGEHNYVWDATAPDGRRPETDAEVYARLGESPDRCSAGEYNHRCRRPADDPMHQPSEGAAA